MPESVQRKRPAGVCPAEVWINSHRFLEMYDRLFIVAGRHEILSDRVRLFAASSDEVVNVSRASSPLPATTASPIAILSCSAMLPIASRTRALLTDFFRQGEGCSGHRVNQGGRKVIAARCQRNCAGDQERHSLAPGHETRDRLVEGA